MGHLRRPQANSDLDDIGYYIATSSGGVEIADRLVDSLTDRFVLLGGHPNPGRTREGPRGSRNLGACSGAARCN